MSYKDGIPLLTSFEDGADDDDDFNFDSVIRPARRWPFSRRHLIFALVLTLSVVLIIGIVVGITVPVVILQGHGASEGTSGQGNSTGGSASNVPPTTSLTPLSASLSVTLSVSTAVNGSFPPVTTTTSVMATPLPTSIQSSSIVHTTSTNVPTSSAAMATSSGPPTLTSMSSETSSGVPTPTSMSSVTSSGLPTPTSMSSVAMETSTGVPTPTSMSSVATETNSGLPIPTPTIVSSVAMETSSGLPIPTPTTTSSVAMETSTVGTVSMAPSPTPSPHRCSNDSSICQSQYDDRSYSVLSLSNNSLTILLVSDPSSNVSSASMDVAAGSFNDPPDYEGLAHFCEHMLFLGTEEFPDEHEYSQFLSTHGGYDNAFTSTQETNYYFDVESTYFERALHMFSQFFISPLLSESSVMREIHAVNAEHKKNLENDAWRAWQLLKHVSNPEHPFSQFNTGSLDTLNKSDIHDRVVDYYNTTYSASTMKLVIYGPDSIEDLTDYATTYFSDVPNNHATPVSYNTTSFPDDYSGQIVYFYPIASTHTLTLYWQVVPSLQDQYRHDVAVFLNRYLGHEGNTSLSHYLMVHQLATSLSAGVEVQTDTYTLFSLQLELTDSGLRGVSDVIRLVFQSVSLLQTLSQGEFDEMWSDFLRVKQVLFDFSERAKPRDYTTSTAQTMRVVADAADYLLNPERFQPVFTLVNSTANQLTPGSALIFIGSQSLSVSEEAALKAGLNTSHQAPLMQTSHKKIDWPQLNSTEPIYSTPFHKTSVTLELIDYWSVTGSEMTFDLPGPNTFIPSYDDLMIIEKQDGNTAPEEIVGSVGNHSNGTSLWWLLDSRDFPQPLVDFRCVINSSNAEETPAWEASSTLFSSFVLGVLEPQLYGASEVGYSLSIDPFPHGLALTFSGFSDDVVIGNYITMVTEALTNSDGQLNDEAIFNTTKDSLLSALNNYNFTKLPFRYTYGYLQQVVMERPYWTNEQVIAELQGLGHSEVVDFGVNTLLNNATLLCLAHGNVDEQNATSYLAALTDTLQARLVPPANSPDHLGHFWRRRIVLEQGANFSVSLPTLNPADTNSVVNVLYQVGNVYKDPSLALHLTLLAGIIDNECFYELRTKQQLGYVVFCFQKTNNEVGSFQVVVQSEEYGPEHVLNSIDEFLQSYYDVTIQSDNFTHTLDEQQEVLRSTLQRREPSLGDRTDRLWAQVTNGQLHFDLSSELLSMLSSDSINATSLASFYSDYLLDASVYRKLVLLVYGEGKGYFPNVEYPLDYSSLRQNATQYPYLD